MRWLTGKARPVLSTAPQNEQPGVDLPGKWISSIQPARDDNCDSSEDRRNEKRGRKNPEQAGIVRIAIEQAQDASNSDNRENRQNSEHGANGTSIVDPIGSAWGWLQRESEVVQDALPHGMQMQIRAT